MNRKSFSCLIAVLIAFILIAQTGRAEILPGDNPVQFRNSLHPDFYQSGSKGPVVIPDVQPLNFDHIAKAALNFEDLAVSESVSPANFTQSNSDNASLKDGRLAAVWEDDRRGPVGIYLQLFDNDGNPIDGNSALIVGDDYNLTDPRICADTTGHFYVVWREEMNGYLQAARFDSLANMITPVFMISDTLLSAYTGFFDAACLPDGRLLVAWEHYTADADIYFQLFTTAGIASTDMTKANSDGAVARHWSPAVAGGANGDFALVWEDYRNGTPDIYFRRYSSLGIPYSGEILLGDMAADSSRFMPSLAYGADDGYTAGWVDLRNGQNIYMQRLTAAGALSGNNFLLTTGSSGLPNWEITLAANASGNLLAAWTIYTSNPTIMMQRFLPNVQIDGAPQTVSASTSANRHDPSITGSGSGHITLTWTDMLSGSADILGTVYASDGSAVKSAFVINDDDIGSPSIEPQAVNVGPYEWSVVFTDKRRDTGDIMLQRIYVGGDLLGGNRLINADAPGGKQSQPAVSSLDEQLLISWTDEREGAVSGQNIFCRFSAPGYSITDEMVVNDDHDQSAAHYNSANAINENGVSIVVWTDTRNGNPQIYGQLFDQTFQKIGANFLIGPSAAALGEMARVDADAHGNFIIAYLNRLGSGGPTVEVKQVTPAGGVSDLFAFASDVSGFQINDFDAGVNNADQLILAWQGVGTSGTELFMTVFDYSGSAAVATAAVTDNFDAAPDSPDLCVDNLGYPLLTWIDHRTGAPSPFRQIFDNSFLPLQTNLPTYISAAPLMQHPVAAGYLGKGLFVWCDARSDGLNIYASQDIYEPTGVDDERPILPARFDLSQNYPNPFNPSTVIKFSLPRAGHVRLEIFNLLGQLVRTLADAEYPTGEFSVIWDGTQDDGRKVSSGIYFYRLTSGNESCSRQMTFIK
jgi:hypothetical protein